ncbi:MAG: hypothetical protein ABSC56_04935 [Solirubrobacteraceae bacterium]
MSPLISRLLLIGLLVVGVVVAVRHFDTHRSVEAVCHVWDTNGLALHNQLAQSGTNASSDPLAALGNLTGAAGQVGGLMSQMAAVAPSDVEPDFQELATAFNQLQSSEGSGLSDPLAALGSAVVTGFSVQGATNAVNQFLATNCGIPGASSSSGG